jgi:thiaminase/transcriptional activator TenA
MRRAFLLLTALWSAPALCQTRTSTSFTEQLWAGSKTIYAQTLQHPFLKGLAAGTLPKARFEFYLLQDGKYLGAFADALRTLAEKAPRETWAATLRRHAEEAVAVERQFHEKVLTSFGVDEEEAERAAPAPTTYAYTNHFKMAVQDGTFGEGLAALLPCYWIYWEVGKELVKSGSKNADYKRWIEQYASAEYGESVKEVLDMMDAEAANMGPEERLRAIDLFILGARYEYMFWDMAWRQEQWPPARPASTGTGRSER